MFGIRHSALSMTTDILLSQRFVPEFGGSIRWMHEVYRRWPGEVRVITHDYYNHPPRTAEFPGEPQLPDAVTDDNLTMDRRDIFMRDWGLESLARAKRYWRMTRAVGEAFGKTRGVVRVHCTHAVPEVVSLLPLRAMYGRRLQVVCYAHGEEITACCSSRQLKWLMRRAHGIVDVMIANSTYTQQLASQHIDPAKVHVINPGVDLREFDGAAELGERWRHDHGFEDRLIVLTIGRLDPRKNQVAILEAIANLRERHPSVMYVLAGDGRNSDALRKRADDLQVSDRVLFPGSVDGPTRLAMFGACDVFAMPAVRDGTDVEGFGMVFLEAGACGKPVIAGNTGGQPDAVRDGETGLIVDGSNIEQVTASLDALLSDKDRRDALGLAGQAHAQRFDWPRVVQRTVQLVDQMS
jgi:phosphatidylinositol alpha-1,6-mannosyltransferase